MHTVYGIDLEDGCLTHRSMRWFTTRVMGLVAIPDSRLRRRLTIQED